MKPNRKVSAGGAAGLASTVLVWILGQFGVVMPAEVAVATATLLTFGVSYFVSEKKNEAV